MEFKSSSGAALGKDAGLQVVFGTGPVAQATAAALLGRGLRVRMVNRSGKLPAGFSPAGALEVVAANAMELAGVRSAAAGATHIYNCAHPLYHQWNEVLPVFYGNMASAALDQGAVLGVAQNLYMYARGVPVIDEKTPIDPPSRKGRIAQRVHEILEQAGVKRGLRWTAVRASDFYGPGATEQSLFGATRFLDPLLSGRKPMLFGNPDQPHTYTYVGDFGHALAVAALSPTAHGKAWIAPNDRTVSTRQMADLFFAAAGRSPGFRAIPRSVLVLLGVINPVIRELPEMLYQKEEPYVVDGSLFAETFVFQPTTLEEGVRRTLEWYAARSDRKGRQAHGERAA